MSWPYSDEDGAPAESPAPTWDCPGRDCECHPVEAEADDFEYTVMLFSPTGERMANALHRVHHGGRVVAEGNADGSGSVTVRLTTRPHDLLVEWAPEDGPKTPGYPFRRRHLVELGDDAGRRRLNNLGFTTRMSVRENVKSFQAAYNHETVTGDLGDIDEDLTVFHDDVRPPIVTNDPEVGPAGGGGGGGGRGRNLLALQGQPTGTGKGSGEVLADTPTKKLPPQKSAPPPATKGAKVPLGKGPVQSPAIIPDPDTIATTDALYEFIPMEVHEGSEVAVFFVFSDALMWEVPNDATWSFWKGTASEQPFPQKPFTGKTITDRKRLIRPQVDGFQAEKIAKAISVTQDQLRSRLPLIELSEKILPTTSTQAEPCLLPTAELYDHAYVASGRRGVQIVAQPLPITKTVKGQLEYAEKVAKEIQRVTGGKKQKFSALLGTPGKIWAVADRMDTMCTCKDANGVASTNLACINHGFHINTTGTAPAKAGDPGTNFVIHLHQFQGGCHSAAHKDYSQIFWAVAGWCLVKDATTKDLVWTRTEKVYTDTTLAKLVRVGFATETVTATGGPGVSRKAGFGVAVPETHYTFKVIGGKPLNY